MNKKIHVQEVAERLGVGEQTVRICLQRGLLPFGTAVKQPHSTRYTYIIYNRKFAEYVGE